MAFSIHIPTTQVAEDTPFVFLYECENSDIKNKFKFVLKKNSIKFEKIEESTVETATTLLYIRYDDDDEIINQALINISMSEKYKKLNEASHVCYNENNGITNTTTKYLQDHFYKDNDIYENYFFLLFIHTFVLDKNISDEYMIQFGVDICSKIFQSINTFEQTIKKVFMGRVLLLRMKIFRYFTNAADHNVESYQKYAQLVAYKRIIISDEYLTAIPMRLIAFRKITWLAQIDNELQLITNFFNQCEENL